MKLHSTVQLGVAMYIHCGINRRILEEGLATLLQKFRGT